VRVRRASVQHEEHRTTGLETPHQILERDELDLAAILRCCWASVVGADGDVDHPLKHEQRGDLVAQLESRLVLLLLRLLLGVLARAVTDALGFTR
jgi:hypothetical protein